MPNNICYVYGAGEHFAAQPVPISGNFVIAADGGWDYLNAYGIVPDLLVGDFDSCLEAPIGIETIRLPIEKDNTDMEEALNIGFDRGFRVFHIYGGVGGRIEHTLANIQCIARLAQKGARGFLFDKNSVVTAIYNEAIYFPADATGYVSAFAHSDTASGVFEKGLRYPLDNATLNNTDPIGVSNEFIGTPSEISVRNGTLIIVYPKTAALDHRD